MKYLEKFPNFSNSKILVVGDSMIDKYWFGETKRISPEAPVPVVKINKEEKRLGGAANVALNLASIGCQVTLISLVGDDKEKDFLDKELHNKKIVNKLIANENISTTVKLRTISKNTQLIRQDFESEIEKFKEISLIKEFEEVVKEYNLIIFSDYAKGTLCEIDKFIKIAKRYKIPTLVDPKQSLSKIYKGATLLKPNYKEFESMVGKCKTEEEFDKKAFELISELDLESLVVTRGSDGISLYQKGDIPIKEKAKTIEVFDVTGAGDTVIAILGAFISKGLSLDKAIVFANEAAGIVIGRIGTSSISETELKHINYKSNCFTNKLIANERLSEKVRTIKSNNQKIVMTNGCFDIIHAGHVDYLTKAKTLGDKLIVAINSDASIKTLKGPDRPINDFKNRVKVLSALSVIDFIVMFDSESPFEVIKKINPDILVKGADYEIKDIIGSDYVISYGGEVQTINLTEGQSTTKIIQKIINKNY